MLAEKAWASIAGDFARTRKLLSLKPDPELASREPHSGNIFLYLLFECKKSVANSINRLNHLLIR